MNGSKRGNVRPSAGKKPNCVSKEISVCRVPKQFESTLPPTEQSTHGDFGGLTFQLSFYWYHVSWMACNNWKQDCKGMKHVVVIEITTHLFSDFSPIVRLAGWQRVLSKNWFGKLFLLKPETRHRSFLKVHNKILTSFKVRTAQWGRSNFFFQDSTSVEKET